MGWNLPSISADQLEQPVADGLTCESLQGVSKVLRLFSALNKMRQIKSNSRSTEDLILNSKAGDPSQGKSYFRPRDLQLPEWSWNLEP